MDSLASERAMTYVEPNIYASRDYVSVHVSERPTSAGYWWTANQRFTITIRSPGQNEFIDANRMRLQFSAVSVVLPGNFVTAGNGGIDDNPTNPYVCRAWNHDQAGLSMACKSDSASMMPGVPFWGCPFFSSVRVTIPGLPIESFCTTDIESQWMIASRLLCSSGTGSWNDDCPRVSFKISGEPELAGARSVIDRAVAVTHCGIFTDRGGAPVLAATNSTGPITAGVAGDASESEYGGSFMNCRLNSRSQPINYSVPLSLFCHLFNGASNLLPLAFYSTASDTVTFTFNMAPTASAVNDLSGDLPQLVGLTTYYVIDPAISFTKLQINNPAVLASLEALYRGVTSVPIAPGVNVPVAMVMKFINYMAASTTLARGAGQFNLSIPANQPSMRALMFRFAATQPRNLGLLSGTVPLAHVPFQATDTFPTVPARFQLNPYSVGSNDGQWNGRYLLSPQPVIQNLVLRIASFRVPLDPLSDLLIGAVQQAGPPNDPTFNGELNRRYYAQPNPIPPGLGTTEPFVYATYGSLPFDGTTQANWFANPHNAAPVLANQWTQQGSTGPLTVDILSRERARYYKMARILFSPYANEDHPAANALAPFFATPFEHATGSAAIAALRGYFLNQLSVEYPVMPDLSVAFSPAAAHAINQAAALAKSSKLNAGAAPVRYTGSSQAGTTLTNPSIGQDSGPTGWPKIPLPYYCNDGVFCLPFESLPHVYNHADDAFALRGLDLRSITTMELSGEIISAGSPSNAQAGGMPPNNAVPAGGQGAGSSVLLQNSFPGVSDPRQCLEQATNQGTRDEPSVAGWTLRAWVAYDHEHVLLPGRIDTEAQFSLIPTGNTAIPSGGAAAM